MLQPARSPGSSSRVALWSALATVLLAAAALVPATFAAAPDPLAVDAQPLAAVELLTLARLDNAALLAEDASQAGPGIPLRFARTQPVFWTPTSTGTWETLADGSQLWRLRVLSPGAVSLNLGFTRYRMPPGGTLVLYDAAAATVIGPFTERDNKPHHQLWTPLIPGEEAVIEVRLPAGERQALELELTAVNHGYRPLDAVDKSGSCNVDVVCSQGNAWRAQIRSVARVIIGGVSLCTGFMVNNTAQDLTPYFMTADHCDLTPGNAGSLVVYWNYQNSTCRPPGSASSGGQGNGNLGQFQSGAIYRAGSSTSDFTLVELDSLPPPAYDVHWAGWDARGNAIAGAVAIHHPQGDEKRISFENDATVVTSYLGTSSPGNGTHVRVIDWDLGTTEGGSSGSPLFDPNGRVIGQLHGGFAACGNDDSDWYGRFSTSWNLGLRQWLDPGNTGQMVLNGRDQMLGDDDDDDDDDVEPFECVEDDFTLCLNGGRFQVTVEWTDFDEVEHVAEVVEGVQSDDSGLFWFLDADNWELLVKVLRNCGPETNDHYWVFAAATTNVGYTLTVIDSEIGKVKRYVNELGVSSPAVTDIEAFATCP